MKRLFHHIYLLLAVMLMAACANDNDAEPATVGDEGFVTLRIAANTAAVTRARTTNWSDTNAEDEEMMNLWVVVVTNTTDGSVVKCFACRPSAGTEREIDEVGRIVKGAYTVYSFANISVTNVCTLLGLTAPDPIPAIDSTSVEIGVTGTVSNAAEKVATINGNGFSPTATNNYGETGIPMSNVQTISATESTKDLIVIRMLAKMKISVKNETGADQYIKYATISNVTSNEANNLKLLPNLTNGANTMEFVHGDIQPNLNGSPTTTELAIPDMATETALANNATREVTFYINECKTGTNFEITIGLGDATSTNEYRYALIDNKGATTTDDGKWDYIARNDYRIIPIVLDDYKLELVPYDFPPIGVYPVSVSEIDNVNHVYNFTFHDYGHFHLVPRVTHNGQSSSNPRVSVPFTSTAPSGTYSSSSWGFVTDGSFASSWGSWTDATKATVYNNASASPAFYRTGEASYITTTTDGDEVGGIPVWYANSSSPRWDPDGGTNYVPFIFGYIAEPTLPMTADRKVYHEFSVKLYKEGMTAPRLMTYRFYMTLSKDQMLGARSTVPLQSEGNCTHSFPLPSEGRGRGGVIRRPHNHSRQ